MIQERTEEVRRRLIHLILQGELGIFVRSSSGEWMVGRVRLNKTEFIGQDKVNTIDSKNKE